MPTPSARRKRSHAYRIIAEYTYDWETWVDAKGRTRWINSAVERITGYSVQECLARDDYPLFLVHRSDRARIAEVMQSAQRGEAGNDVEFRVRCKNKRTRWVAVSWQSMHDERGRSLGYRSSVRDIDDRKRMEHQVDRLRRRAERAATARSELLANVSHELRSPAHCIAGFADLLLGTEMSPEQERHVRVIADQARMMQRQVQDLLQVAALDVGTLRLETAPFDVRALLDSLVDAAQLEARDTPGLVVERAIALDSHWVIGDRIRVAQTVRNLLDNALKFTSQGSVRLTAVREADGMFVIEVRDTGIGMTAAQLRRVREPFVQAEGGASRRHGGVGLGLSIVDRLVTAMGGELELISRRGQGTRARLRLPLAPTAPQTAAIVAAVAPVSHGTALVVDDSAVARELMAEWLHTLGWRTISAGSGKDALSRAEDASFDLILLDYQMPGLDGGQTALQLRRLHKRQQLEMLPYIALVTANVFVADQLGEAHGAIDRILVKPIQRSDLAAVLADAAARVPRLREVNPSRVQELLTTRSMSGASMLARLFEPTVQEQTDALTDLDAAVEAGQLEQMERAAHRIAGLSATIGADETALLARQLMERATDPELPGEVARRLAASIREAWVRAQANLASALHVDNE